LNDIGDALGMPTQLLPHRQVAALFPSLDWFVAGPPENDISRGQAAGTVTDDIAQAVIVAELLIADHGHVDSHDFVQRLLAWARDAEANGAEQLGPSSRRALEAIQRGLPLGDADRRGDTNGGAMRIAPVGIATSAQPLERLVDRVAEACRATHNTGVAIAGAAAVATAVSAGVAGASFAERARVTKGAGVHSVRRRRPSMPRRARRRASRSAAPS